MFVVIDSDGRARLDDEPPSRAPAPAPLNLRAALRSLLSAMDEWSTSGDARDHGDEEGAEAMRKHAITALEDAFLGSAKLRELLPDLWALVEVGAADAVFERRWAGHHDREEIETLLARK